MSAKAPRKVVVAGDVAIDWLQYPVSYHNTSSGGGKPPIWASCANTRMVARPGGAMLLANMVKAATGATVVGPEISEIESVPPEKVIHANALLSLYPKTSSKEDSKNVVYRVKTFHGYAGPEDCTSRTLDVTGPVDGAGVIILDDAGNGFRDDGSLWKGILDANPDASVILKMNRPLMEGKLWEELVENHCGRVTAVAIASHMRECGVNMSRCLSWERTAQDFVRQMRSNDCVEKLTECAGLIVLFGPDAALHYVKSGDSHTATLYYDPKLMEDGHRLLYPGDMYGLTYAFISSLTKHLLDGGAELPDDGIRSGLNSSRKVFELGFGAPPAAPDFSMADIFEKTADSLSISSISVPFPGQGQPEWTVLGDLSRAKLETIAYNLVRDGADPLLGQVPRAQFGALEVIDRTEIESYQSVRNLMVEYIGRENPPRPLSIAVFGPPGAGKSFGVTELANSIAPGKVETIEFNVSQFQSSADLISALHRVRDKVLEGRIPLVFFDEFDSQFGGELGWLKYFLMPMQDGKFKDGESIHPIGKAIFVFAGGTSFKFSDFYPSSLATDDGAMKQFAAVKGPDFVSRLRGYINILGRNPAPKSGDSFYMIRRAMLLRFMLKKSAPGIFNGKVARVDPGVLCAMIKVPRYKHGVRSMLAIIEMSRLSDRRVFEQSALPPKDQLDLHVDADMFTRIMLQEVLFGESLEKMAKAIHEKYLRDNKGQYPDNEPAMKPWEQLSKQMKDSNHAQAASIPEKLRAVKCGIMPSAEEKVQIGVEFTSQEVELLAKMEHERFVKERLSLGWRLGPRDDEKKTRPSLVPWEELSEDERKRDRDTAYGLPEFLAAAGFEIYRLP